MNLVDLSQVVRRLRPMGLGGDGLANDPLNAVGVHLGRDDPTDTIVRAAGDRRLLGAVGVHLDADPAVRKIHHPTLMPELQRQLRHRHRSPS